MKLTLFLIVIFSVFFPAGYPEDLDKSALKKLEKAVESAFQSESFELLPTDSLNDIDPGAQVFLITRLQDTLGYAWLDSAPGRYENFDFAVIYDRNWVIAGVEILVYRSSHGFEIMNRRWLSQFKGTDGCNLEYGKDIDAVSGATISGNSLVSALGNICGQLKRSGNFDQENH